ncbi:glutaredoxin [Deinococcus sp. HSC-46F16]|uniref:glutaredoxin family protein n=1 Tax=Deinococcus sp. HSC-46F16 TaxID=2910968 RepID=UPI0020A22B81|nr:glutaredoxin family protein [Deinococcus sp. HSC-46F16]MCP2013872.1 glutaredoxin [Deinococcus sp. HSC-46F16]
MSRLPPLTLYTRRGCHLCEQAEERLRLLDFAYTPVDVDSDPALRARYGDDVPVLSAGERVLLKGVLSRARLSELKLRLLRGAGADS